jgi:sialic acid synthase SpsE
VNGVPAFMIAGRPIGPGYPPFIVAELSGNHNGDLRRALALIDAAKQAGADAVKLQTYTADTITLDCDAPAFRIAGGPWDGRRLYDLYREASTPWEWHPALFARCREIGLPVFSTPFDPTAVEYLEAFEPPAYKIASFELVDLPLIERAEETGRPSILSTGMATLAEIEAAIAAARTAGCRDLAVLHCVSSYPADPADDRLRTIPDLAARTAPSSGSPDHSLGTTVAVARSRSAPPLSRSTSHCVAPTAGRMRASPRSRPNSPHWFESVAPPVRRRDGLGTRASLPNRPAAGCGARCSSSPTWRRGRCSRP